MYYEKKDEKQPGEKRDVYQFGGKQTTMKDVRLRRFVMEVAHDREK